MFFHSHAVLLASLSFDIFLPCYITKSILCTTKNLHKDTQTQAYTNRHKSLYCTTQLAQSSSQDYFVLQKLAGSTFQYTTSYYYSCTNYFSVLLRTAKVAQAFPSTTLHYKGCTKYSPVLVRTTSLHKALSSTTSHYKYKTCTKYSPVLLRSTKLAHSSSQYYFVHLRTTKLAQRTAHYFFVLRTCT